MSSLTNNKIKQDSSERDYIIVIEPEPLCINEACSCRGREEDRNKTCKLWQAFRHHHLRLPDPQKEQIYVLEEYQDALELRRRVGAHSPKEILSYVKTCLDKFAGPASERRGYEEYEIRILEEWA